MAMNLPNGSTVYIASAFDAEKTATAVTNAVEAVVTCAGHGLATGDFIVFDSGWGKLAGRCYRVSQSTTETFKLDGINTTDTAAYPAGVGVGKFRKVKSWTQLTQILEVSVSGGEQQYYTYGFLEDDFERQLPTVKTAQAFTFSVADDPAAPGYQAAVAAEASGVRTPMHIRLKSGSVLAYNGTVSVNKVPTLTRNEGMRLTINYALDGEINRY